MKRLVILALVGCGTDAPVGGATLVLDVPDGALAPGGFTAVEITIHDASGDTVRSAAVADGRFDLGDIDPRTAASIEAVLRNDNGTAVGYGRTPAALDLTGGATITLQVRRPILYIAGANYFVQGTTDNWFGQPATFSDLSTGAAIDGSSMAAAMPALMIAAGPQLYALDHAVNVANGSLSAPAAIRAVSTADHSMSPQLGTLMQGVALDGVGSDDGGTLIVGTTEKLYVVDARPEAPMVVREVASGRFGRVALVAGADGSLGAVAIQDRVDTAAGCTPTAKLWWIENLGGEVIDAKVVAMSGGFADVASDRGRAWYVDACKGELGEATALGLRSIRTDLGRPTALAVSNGQAWIGIERPPTTLALVVASVEAMMGTPRTLWTEPQEQVLAAVDYPGVERRLSAQAVTFQQLEVGAGGDYIAAVTTGQFHGDPVPDANFPRMDIETRELRVFDAASGGTVQRYRSWCDGSYLPIFPDIDTWRCATTTGQTAPTNPRREHRLTSMTFLFGKK